MEFSDTDICSGCVFEDNKYGSHCRIKERGKDKVCPCVECLLKCMCMKSCPTYDKLLCENR